MGGSREKVQADFDLERFIDMFDEALTSKDERVVNALRSLMMMVILTKPEGRDQSGDGENGPLRQLFDDLHNLNRRMHSMENTLSQVDYRTRHLVEEKTYSSDEFWVDNNQSIYKTFNTTAQDYARIMKNINSPKKIKK